MRAVQDPNELLVVVDEADHVLGFRTRRECHADRSLLHRSVAVLVETEEGRIYQRRSFRKDSDPGVSDLSCTGHVDAGEDADVAARRELAEELGLADAAPELVGRLLVDLPEERELCAVYQLRSDGPFALMLPEVIGLAVYREGERPAPLSEFAEQVLRWFDHRST